jgi:branched-subunit amino acid aminotransferase/4-amino-4-deoxychorismate lyase
MLLNGKTKEQVLFLDDLISADKIFVGNSLRGLISADLTG